MPARSPRRKIAQRHKKNSNSKWYLFGLSSLDRKEEAWAFFLRLMATIQQWLSGK